MELSDIIIPSFCPLLEIPLFYNPNKVCSNSPSVDRLDSEKGYIKGNIWVISHRANSIKLNATIEEIELLAKKLRNKIEELKNKNV